MEKLVLGSNTDRSVELSVDGISQFGSGYQGRTSEADQDDENNGKMATLFNCEILKSNDELDALCKEYCERGEVHLFIEDHCETAMPKLNAYANR